MAERNAVGVTAQGQERIDQLSRHWRPALMAFFLRRVRNADEAEDLTQEVLKRILETSREAPDPYVFKIAQNLIRDNARKASVRKVHHQAIAGDEERGVEWIDPHQIVSGREQLAIFTAALDRVSERSRHIFVLFRIEGMSQDLIASAYGISVSTVKKHVAQVSAHLARAMRSGR